MGTNSGYRVAIIGGGIAGLTAAYELARQGIAVTLYEKEHVLGGLASSFPLDDGYLERYYHFICLNDQEYFQMLAELGLED
ncbi:MAG: FAD-dependent oxidoreductase, partial [Anaerolineae bacterium]|nr:FAD-dependent oxidoreductase [Anaerolineae bacterium]